MLSKILMPGVPARRLERQPAIVVVDRPDRLDPLVVDHLRPRDEHQAPDLFQVRVLRLRPSMIDFSVARSRGLRISAVRDPPAFSMLCMSIETQLALQPRSTSLMTSGLVCSMFAIRLMTSICFCSGRPP